MAPSFHGRRPRLRVSARNSSAGLLLIALLALGCSKEPHPTAFADDSAAAPTLKAEPMAALATPSRRPRAPDIGVIPKSLRNKSDANVLVTPGAGDMSVALGGAGGRLGPDRAQLRFDWSAPKHSEISGQ